MQKIIIGCPVWNAEWVLDYWLDAMELQKSDAYELQTAFLISPSQDNTREFLLKDDRVNWVIPGPESPRKLSDYIDHIWNEPFYKHMAKVRNMLVSWCQKMNVAWFFSVDSDIILPPETLPALLKDAKEVNADVISPLVLMNPDGMSADDPAWNYMFWNKDLEGISASRLNSNPVVEDVQQVDVLMAAMLLNRKAQKCRWYSHTQGEDIGWSVDAYNNDLRLFVHKGIQAEHLVKRGW